MRPYYFQSSQPEFEPVSYDEVAMHVRVDSEDDMALVESLIPVAREYIEGATGRVMGKSQWTLSAECWRDMFCDSGRYAVPFYRTPLVSVDSVKYYDTDGDLITLDAGGYIAIPGREPGLARFTGNLPIIGSRPDAIQIAFTAGYENCYDISPGLRHAVKIMVAHLYDNRGAIAFSSPSEIPFTLRTLIESQRIAGWVA